MIFFVVLHQLTIIDLLLQLVNDFQLPSTRLQAPWELGVSYHCSLGAQLTVLFPENQAPNKYVLSELVNKLQKQNPPSLHSNPLLFFSLAFIIL